MKAVVDDVERDAREDGDDRMIRGNGNSSRGIPSGMRKKCGSKDIFCCNAAIAVPPVAKRNPPATLKRSRSRDNVK